MLDVRRIRVLSEVVSGGSFSAAADALHLSQSAVSQQVAALERETGMQLLDRTSDGPRLTPAGEALMEHGNAVIARLDEAERELAEIAGLEGGRLRVISFPTASATIMTLALAEFRRAYPQVELEFAEDEPENSFPALRRGDFDLAVVFDYKNFPLDFGRDAEAELIYEEPIRVALPSGHPLAASDAVRVKDLADEDWLCGALPSSCRFQVIELCKSAGFEPRISFQSEDYEVIKGFVAAGLVTPVRRVWAVSRPAESRPPAAEKMLGVLRGVCESYREERGLRAAA
jgi:DNA-binding transcriptional LysR family regulator